MVTHLSTRVHLLVTALRDNKPKPQCGRNTLIRAGSFAGPFLPATRLALPWALCKDRDIDGRGSALPSAIKLENVLDCQAKILEAAGFSSCLERFHSIPESHAGSISMSLGGRFEAVSIIPETPRQAFSILLSGSKRVEFSFGAILESCHFSGFDCRLKLPGARHAFLGSL
jgi:hypothetical protein